MLLMSTMSEADRTAILGDLAIPDPSKTLSGDPYLLDKTSNQLMLIVILSQDA